VGFRRRDSRRGNVASDMAAVSNNSVYGCVTNFAGLSADPDPPPCGCPFWTAYLGHWIGPHQGLEDAKGTMPPITGLIGGKVGAR